MNKSEFIDAVAEKAGVTKADASRVYDAIWEQVTETVKDGGKVSIPKFGTFSLGERAAREGRNPQTGATVKIAASKSVKFKQSSALKAELN